MPGLLVWWDWRCRTLTCSWLVIYSLFSQMNAMIYMQIITVERTKFQHDYIHYH